MLAHGKERNVLTHHTKANMRRVILKTTQSPGDEVMLTAAVREWKRALRGRGGDRCADAVPGAVGE